MKADLEKFWAGPIPYSVSQEKFFFGRKDKIDDFVNMIDDSNLSLLTGGSGVGKSSFLYAGVLPKLKEKYNSPIFLVKNWGAGAIKDEDDILNQIRSDINKNSSNEEYKEFLSDLPEIEDLNLYDQIRQIANENKLVVLIFDQFEEIIRSGSNNVNFALDVLSNFVQDVNEVSIVLSFREEHYITFTYFESIFGGISNHTLRLEQLSKSICREGILEPICDFIKKELSIEIESSVYNEILNECVITNFWESENENKKRRNISDESKIDLLAMQAVMKFIYEFALKKGSTKIDDCLFKEYKDNIAEKAGVDSNTEIESTVINSLYVWFNDAINACVNDKEVNLNHELTLNGKVHSLKSALFYSIVEICPNLAYDSYKKNWNENDLIEHIINKGFDEISSGQIKFSKVEEKQDGIWQLCNDSFSGEIRSLFNEIPKPNTKLSYEFIENLKNNYLRESINNSFSLLAKNNILKRSTMSKENVCSIRHDKLGKVADIWAKNNKSSFRYAEQNYKRTGALDIELISKKSNKNTFTNLRFRATFFYSTNNNIYSDVTFNNSDFTACVFEKIHFQNCTFKNESKFEGAVFIDCTFDDVRFEDCSFKGAMFKSRGLKDSLKIEKGGLVFKGCDVLISEFSDIKLNGELKICTHDKKKKRFIKLNNIKREKEFSLSSIRIASKTSIGKIIFDKDVKSNNLMLDKEALTVSNFESAKINGFSLLG